MIACHNVSKFKNFISDVDNKTYLIGNGDIFDMILATDPRYKKGVENWVVGQFDFL